MQNCVLSYCTDLRELLGHVVCKSDAIVALLHIVQLLKEAAGPLVYQCREVCPDLRKSPQEHSNSPAWSHASGP